MAKRRRLNFELVLVQGCSFNIRMGGVGPFFGKFGPGVNILWHWGRVGLGFGLIIAGFQHDFIGNFGFGENGLFGNFASGVNISCQITPDDATLSFK